jgi:hypothetical protein
MALNSLEVKHVFVVSCDEAKWRCAVERIRAAGIEAERVHAVLGIEDETCAKLFQAQGERVRLKRQISCHSFEEETWVDTWAAAAAKGLSLRYCPGGACLNLGKWGLLRTWQMLLERDLEGPVAIFEDDVYLKADFAAALEAQAPLLREADVCYLGANLLPRAWRPSLAARYGQEVLGAATKNADGLESGKPFAVESVDYAWICGTYGLVLSSKALKVVREALRCLENNDYPLDILIFRALRDGLQGRICNPQLVVPDVVGSSLQAARDQFAFLHSNVPSARIAEFPGLDVILNASAVARFRFCVVIVGRNCARYLKRCLNSVYSQTFRRIGACRVIVRLDAPEDDSEATARELLEPSDLLLRSSERQGPARARHECYWLCSDDEICVLLDADDYLYDPHVLCNLALRYAETSALVTYGGMRYLKDGKLGAWWRASPFSEEVVERRSYRKESWRATHLKTAYAAVLKAVPPEYLQLRGEWLLICTDVALMNAALELAGRRHAPNDFSSCVYDVDASMTEATSYYRRHEDPIMSAYRSEAMAYLSNLPALESRNWHF